MKITKNKQNSQTVIKNIQLQKQTIRLMKQRPQTILLQKIIIETKIGIVTEIEIKKKIPKIN
jgi:hypothetical protein